MPHHPLFSLPLCAACLLTSACAAAPPMGLQRGPDGGVLKDGKPYHGVGVNYYDCFLRTLRNADDTSYDAGFRTLAERGIPFVRFSAFGFWPKEMHLYRTDRPEFFRRLDGVVHSAQRHGVGLIPSFFWHLPCLPDLAGEPMDQWGDPKSRTHAFLREYVREVVTRTKNSPALWAWEFGNEYDLACDLPNAAEQRPPVYKDMGTAAARTQRDELTYAMLATALREFAQEIRRHDTHRLITSGNAMPRDSAWHNLKEKSWTKDSPQETAAMIALTHPDPLDLLSVHCYGDDLARVDVAAAESARLKKPLFVGEFQITIRDPEEARKRFIGFLDTLERLQVPLAAVWVFDFPAQDKDFNVTATNVRAWQLDILGQRNRKLGGRQK